MLSHDSMINIGVMCVMPPGGFTVRQSKFKFDIMNKTTGKTERKDRLEVIEE